ncbi:hypothetical protein CHELA41_24499 [Hyphomicrobiales bacterium]|nr:hypothetical protein CHELA41_24499 [Hyphomicrobiales bacterium]
MHASYAEAHYFVKMHMRAFFMRMRMIGAMITGEEIRALMAAHSWTQSDLAGRIGVKQSTVSRWLGGQTPDPAAQEKLEAIMRGIIPVPAAPKPEPNVSVTIPPPTFGEKTLPILGRAVGGEDGRFVFNGDVIEYVAMPPQLQGVPGAYGVFVSGTSMMPRFNPGEQVWVHPSRPPHAGNDVVVQLKGDGLGDPPDGFIKRFVAWTPQTLIVEQFNPPHKFEFDRKQVESVHVVVGSIFTP